MKINCDITQDLLPLYIEDMVNRNTQELIKEHLNECKICENKYIQMKNKDYDVSFHDINKLKIFRKHIMVIISLSILIQVIASLVVGNFFIALDSIRITLISLYIFLPLISFLLSWKYSNKNIVINIIIVILFGLFGTIIPLTIVGTVRDLLSFKVTIILVAYTVIPAIIGIIVGKGFMLERRKKFG